ncbi:MAG: HNH endonuclease [Arcobacter sp.]|nr:MAG: HNH endonuclease [Arcobacter sp.]
MPKKICNQLGCNVLIGMTVTHCPEHEKFKNQDRNRDYNKYKRNQEHQTFHNSKDWKVARAEALTRTGGLCEDCLQMEMIVNADVVDHMISIKKDYSKRLEQSNLRPLCHAHHNRKTGSEDNE